MISDSTELKDTDERQRHSVEVCNRFASLEKPSGSRYSRMDQVKFVEDSLQKIYLVNS